MMRIESTSTSARPTLQMASAASSATDLPRSVREEISMRVSSFVFRTMVFGLSACAIAAVGCSVSVTAKAKTKFIGQNAVTAQGTMNWTGQKIVVENANGDMSVAIGSATTVSASMKPFAFANDDDKASADLAIADVQTSFTITETADEIHVQCGVGKSHGSADNGLTGCDNLTVTIPAGSATTPNNLIATAHNGSVVVGGIAGSAIVHSDNGDSTLTVATVTKGAAIESSSGNGDATLTLPGDFAADKILISVPSTGRFQSTFSDVTATTTSRGTAGTGAGSVVIKSDNGDLILN
jgi:hypothetical protein